MRGLARVLLAGILLSGCRGAVASEIRLNLSDGNGNPFHSVPVAVGERFTMRFTHSAAKSPVEEIFEIIDVAQFALRETVYADFGWGLPHKELPGQSMEFEDGRIRLTGYDTRFRELVLRVGRIADHHIFAGGESIRLADYVRPGGEVKIFLRESH